MQEVILIFPHQLFNEHPSIKNGRPVYLVEEWLFFKQYNFHKQKLLLHRASMKSFEQQLLKQKIPVQYIPATDALSDIQKLLPHLAKQKITTVYYADVADNWLQKRIDNACKKFNIKTVVSPTPNFLNELKEVQHFFDNEKKYFQTAFYIDQRAKRNILIDAAGKPAGGRWSFDADNRLKYPKNTVPPVVTAAKTNEFVQEATQYVTTHFTDNYGSIEKFIYPINHTSAEKWLDEFITTRFEKFGMYEDAIVSKEHFLHHSVLTPMLNIGLLSPQQIIDKALHAAAKNNIPLNSLEGFIRQVMGWREFIHIVYEREGTKQRTTNYWGFTRKIPAGFWKATTGIYPVDSVISKVLQTGYSHHIERLMVMGNFMLLCEFDPDEVYRWFMEMYVDAYDWVMVPNVYGMTQFADGGLMTTKPYISGSNYLLKMSDYPKGEWATVWDGLFWRFMHVHRDLFANNQRLKMLLNTFDKMPETKRKKHITVAENYLSMLDKNINPVATLF